MILNKENIRHVGVYSFKFFRFDPLASCYNTKVGIINETTKFILLKLGKKIILKINAFLFGGLKKNIYLCGVNHLKQ